MATVFFSPCSHTPAIASDLVLVWACGGDCHGAPHVPLVAQCTVAKFCFVLFCCAAGDADYVVPFTGSRAWVHDMGMKPSKPWHTWTLQGDDQVCADPVHTVCCDSCQLQPPYCQVTSPEAGAGVRLGALLVTVWGMSWHAVVNALLNCSLPTRSWCCASASQIRQSCVVQCISMTPLL